MKLLLFLGIFLPSFLFAQDEKSLSPYFIITTDSGDAKPDFPLQLSAADVSISGVIADVQITQVYMNKGKKPLEAVYVFPASTRAAVYAMEMKVGRRTIHAEIREKSQARVEYNAAKQNGQTASLLEQERPNIFQMNVANIMPGDSIVVKLSYTELIVPEAGVYEFVYPTVVMPRYTGAVEDAEDPVVPGPKTGGIPYTKAGVKPLYQFDMRLQLHSPVPFVLIESTSHKILLSFEEKNAATVLLAPEEKDGGNRDFILRYKLSGPSIQTGMMTTESAGENFFMFMMQPPARVAPDSIPPREYIFVMDVSGSMSGYPLETSKKLLRNLVSGLRPDDLFNVIQFAGGSQKFEEKSVRASQKNIEDAIAFINQPQGGGGTELKNAMETAMAIPKQEGFARSIVIATDGGISAEASVLSSIHRHLDTTNVFAFGIGSSVNRYLIEGIAFAGNGEPVVVSNASQADSAAEKFRRYISAPVLTNIKVNFGTMDVYDVEPMQVPDLFAERPIVITGKYHGKAEGIITVTGITGKKQFQSVIALDRVKPENKNSAIKYLWARKKVMLLDYENSFDYNRDSVLIKEITAMGLRYSMLTSYTSFIAIDRKERNKEGTADSTMLQPLPMPQGVSDLAILNNISGVQCTSSYTCLSTCTISAVRVTPEYQLTDFAYSTDFSRNGMSATDRFFHGGMPGNTSSANAGPFFGSQYSGLLSDRIPVAMISSYSWMPDYKSGKTFTSDPSRQSDFGFSYYVPYSSIGLLLNDYGGEELNLMFRERSTTHFSFGTRVNERWNGSKVDRNHDSFRDVPEQTGFSVLQYINYTNAGKKLESGSSNVFVHASGSQSGQISNENGTALFQNKDSLFTVYNENKLRFNLPGEYNLSVRSHEGWARRTSLVGSNTYSSVNPFGWAQVYLEHYHGYYTYEAGISGGWFGKEEVLNGEKYGKNYTDFSAYAQYRLAVNHASAQAVLKAEDDSRFGTWISPSVYGTWNLWQNLNLNAGAGRMHAQELTIGSLLPLLYSAKTLSFVPQLLPDDGWFESMGASYLQIFNNGWQASVKGTYVLSEYTRETLIDLDSYNGEIAVYTSGKQPLRHQLLLESEVKCRNFGLKMNYRYTSAYRNYDAGKFSEALLPAQQFCTKLYYHSADYEGNNYRWLFNIGEKYAGAQRLPGHGFSSGFATTDLHAEYNKRRWSFSADVLNLFNYRQALAVYGAENTWSPAFDASMNYAPVIGRVFQLGCTYRLSRL